MKRLLLLVFLLTLNACSNSQEKNLQPPVASHTYPEAEYRVIQTLASRQEKGRVTRLVGWDQKSYYFDWSHATAIINRGTCKVSREQFDLENRGALTLQKGQVTIQNGQVRTLVLQ